VVTSQETGRKALERPVGHLVADVQAGDDRAPEVEPDPDLRVDDLAVHVANGADVARGGQRRRSTPMGAPDVGVDVIGAECMTWSRHS
jgi:hypothetical protein